MNQTVAFQTLGCKQNQFDTQSIRERLANGSLAIGTDPAQADWVVVNTCAVTERAMAKARGVVAKVRRQNPTATLVVIGCGARFQPGQFTAADYVAEFPSCFNLTLPNSPIDSLSDGTDLPAPHGVIPLGKSRALLRIQSGCDQFCSFCIVPHLRGSPRSVTLAECVTALQQLVKAGTEEIVLTGTNVALWGKDLPGAPTLTDLLRGLVSEIGSARLRLSSLEPQLISPGFVDWCLQQPQICRHFHLAVQSGSSRILERMNRGEAPVRLFRYLRDLKRMDPTISLGADVMTGFPGENSTDFDATLSLAESVPFSYLHVFPYSERPGTRAALYAGGVPTSTRLHRAHTLRHTDAFLRKNFMKANLGRKQDIVLLKNRNPDYPEGLTSNYLCVHLDVGDQFSGPRFTEVVAIGSSHLSLRRA